MSERQAEQIVLASRPNGPPTPENFRLEKVAMPTLPAGGVLVRVLYLSLDPSMRGRMSDAKSYAAAHIRIEGQIKDTRKDAAGRQSRHRYFFQAEILRRRRSVRA